MTQITESLKHGAASNDQITQLESLVGATLPADYKEFLHNHNGGRPKPDGFLFQNEDDEEEENVVECFFPVRDVACEEVVVDEIEHLLDWPVLCAWADLQEDECELEDAILPIGTDGSGNYVAIILNGDQAGAVAFFEHEMGRVSRLADSFTSFLEDLREVHG